MMDARGADGALMENWRKFVDWPLEWGKNWVAVFSLL